MANVKKVITKTQNLVNVSHVTLLVKLALDKVLSNVKLATLALIDSLMIQLMNVNNVQTVFHVLIVK